MTRRTRILSAVSALSALGAVGLPAQSGVLVGVSTPTGYETLWIVLDSVRPLRATIPDLLVPRPDGWWRLGTAAICLTSESDDRTMDVLWRVPADSTPVVSEFCHEIPRGELPVPVVAEDSAAADSLKQVTVRCSWSRIQVKFVSPEHIAIGETSGQTEACEPRGGRWYQSHYVSRFHGDSSIALSELADRPIDSIGRTALARAARELVNDEMCTKIAETFDSRELFEVGTEWYPSRVNGRWMPVLFSQLVTGDCQLVSTVDVGLSTALTGHDSLRPPWNILAGRVKALSDAFTSPRGDMVIVQVPDSLVIYRANGGQLGRRVGGVRFREREIVMIQWATGRHVARWNREIVAMMRRGLREARIVPPSKDP